MPRDDGRRPRHDPRLDRQTEPLVEAIGGLAMHSLQIQCVEDHVSLRREDSEGKIVEVPFARGIFCGPAENVPGPQPPLVRQPRGGDLICMPARREAGDEEVAARRRGPRPRHLPSSAQYVRDTLANRLELATGQFRKELAGGRGGRSLDDRRLRGG